MEELLDPSNPVYSRIDDALIIANNEDFWDTSCIDIFPIVYSEIKVVPVADIEIVSDVRRIIELICKLLDFRMLLTFMHVNKQFRSIALGEIERRNALIKDGQPFYSDRSFWYIGRKCHGFEFYYRMAAQVGISDTGRKRVVRLTRAQFLREITELKHDLRTQLTIEDYMKMNWIKKMFVECNRWEEILILGEKSKCRKCLLREELMVKKDDENYDEFVAQKEREITGPGMQFPIAYNMYNRPKKQHANTYTPKNM